MLARSAFSHTMNYRSAVIYGHFERVSGKVDKRDAMDAFMNRLMPGRKLEARPGTRLCEKLE
jgi:nitroimidazol reductase NimA-like FMN-containing flavoprotein (pyridoxamine 5'-phosphate oxidase superfamily)